MKKRKLKMGMVGGGSNAFIGAIHRRAALMENMVELVCGCFSVDPEISRSSGREYFIPEHRIYDNYHGKRPKHGLQTVNWASSAKCMWNIPKDGSRNV